MMKRLFVACFALLLTLGVATMVGPPVSAIDVLSPVCNPQSGQPINTNGGDSPAVCTDNNANAVQNPVYTLFEVVIEILSILIGIASVIVIIISGIRLIVSGGDPNTLAQSRTAIMYAVIGIAVALLCQVIVAFVLKKFTP